jgi:hypothetical protein
MAKPKRILRRIRIAEVSGVDKPAQEHAKALIFKRDNRWQSNMSSIMGDTGNADEAILESVRSILDDDELDTADQVEMLRESVRQYLVATGSTLDNPRFSGPEELEAPIVAMTKALDELRKVDIKARARILENPANRELAHKYNEEMAKCAGGAAAIAKAAGRAKIRPESDEARRNRKKQEQAAYNGPPSKTAAA